MSICQIYLIWNFNFERTRAFHLINDYAPERDHTLNNLAGSFLYVNTLDSTTE